MALAAAAEWHSTAQLAVAGWPLGTQAYWEPELRFPLWEDRSHLLLKGSYLSTLGRVELTPTFVRAGPVLHVEPVAFWDVTARVLFAGYWGAFTSLLPVEDPATVADRATKRAIIDAGERERGWGVRVDLSTRLKAKVGPAIAMVELEARRHHVRAPADPFDWYWDPAEMMVVGDDGWTFYRNLYAFAELVEPADPLDRKLWVGACGNWSVSPGAGDENLKLGPMVMWKPTPAPGVPTLYAGAQVWVKTRFVPTLPPYSFLAANWSR